jgi:hypothetical protein
MLFRLITIITLIKFLLLMISGMDIGTAIYRSLIVFMLLFTIVYLTIFFINIIREDPIINKPSTVQEKDNYQDNSE